MDEPYIRLLLLIVPALFVVANILLFPLLEKIKTKNHFLKKTLTVVIDIYDNDDQRIEQLITEGEIDKIVNFETIEIKRRTQTIFRIPYYPTRILKIENSIYKTDYYIGLDVLNNSEFDKTKGFYKKTKRKI